MAAESSSIAKAAGAYANTSKLQGKLEIPRLPGEKENDPLKPDFTKLLGTALDRGRDAGYKGEAKSAEGLAGTAELHELVAAVSNAELTLNTVVAVRDRIISAYQDIIKMPI